MQQKSTQNSPGRSAVPPGPRLWPVVVFALVEGLSLLSVQMTDPGSMLWFAVTMFVPLLAAAGLVAWWLFLSRLPWRERIIGLAMIAVPTLAVLVLVDPSLLVAVPTVIVPVLVYGVAVGVIVTVRLAWARRRWVLLALFCLLLVPWLFLRVEGLSGDLYPDLRLRWTPSSEEMFVTEAPGGGVTQTTGGGPLTLRSGDWPGFRGETRDSRVRGVTFAVNWAENPPREIWRRKVGPGYSSFAIVDGRAFTQEQMGDEEAVSCYDAATGEPIWQHRLPGRFDEKVSGPGPRATPLFAAGRLYAAGAAGALSCLDAGSGALIWSRDVLEDTGGAPPEWGFSGSPLVVGGVVVTLGGTNGQSLVAYDAESGQKRWVAGSGVKAYASPHIVTIDEVETIVHLTEVGAVAYDPADGRAVWSHEAPTKGASRNIQPAVHATGLIFATPFAASRRVDIRHTNGGSWSVSETWASKRFRPYFSDYVLEGSRIFGFNSGRLTCIDAATGDRVWTGPRTGHGQLLLIEEMASLLVVSEKGELMLVPATDEEPGDVFSIPVLQDKTWNHPAMVGRRLYVRNTVEAACYELPENN